MERAVPFEIGECYHVYNRGVNRDLLFREGRDWERFQSLLYMYNTGKSFAYRDIKCGPYEFDRGEPIVDVLGYALMPNHFHLLLRERREGGISKYLGKILTSFSMYVNTKYARTGPLMCRPFRSRHIDTDEYFRWVFAYVHLNPFRTGNMRREEIISAMREYKYSSYADYYGSGRKESRIIAFDALPIPLGDIGSAHALVDLVADADAVDTFDVTDKFINT